MFKELRPLGIKVATGEHCQNRVVFKQLLQSGGVQFCQIDACRLAGVNEAIAVMLMAKKFGVPVCPHAGGIGLCEMVQHLAIFNYIAISGRKDDAPCEYAEHLHEHFVYPARVKHGAYMCPTVREIFHDNPLIISRDSQLLLYIYIFIYL